MSQNEFKIDTQKKEVTNHPDKAPRKQKKSLLMRFLDMVEKAGNMLPSPATLFAIFAVSVIFISEVASWFDIAIAHPATGEMVSPFSLMSLKGFHMILTDMVTNFTGFAPLGTVLVAMLGIGLAESSGLINAALKKLVLSAPTHLLTFVIVFAGVLSNMASGVGYVLLLPLAALIYKSLGRHPLAGLAAAFSGVAGGYSANLLLGTIDPLLAGISQEGARIIIPSYEVNPASNYYFMAASTFLVAFAGTWVTDKIVEPRLGDYNEENEEEASAPKEDDKNINQVTASERRGLRFTLVALIAIVIFLLAGIIPANGYLREIGTGSIIYSPMLRGIVAIIFVVATILSIAYGVGAGTIKSEKEAIKGMVNSMRTMAAYVVLVFFAAQFVAFFKWTNLGLIIAVEGAEALKESGMLGIPLMATFVIVSAMINMMMGSASAKWAIMAPVFIPMFMMLGYTPEFVQVVYRIGDSVSNAVSPMMSYFALVLAFVERYDKNSGIGSVIAMMLPYSMIFTILWLIFLIIWMLIGIPVGPGAPINLN